MCHTDTWCSRWQLCGQMDLVTRTHIHKHTHACTLYTQTHTVHIFTITATLPRHTFLHRCTITTYARGSVGRMYMCSAEGNASCKKEKERKHFVFLGSELALWLKRLGVFTVLVGQIKETPWCMLTLHIPTPPVISLLVEHHPTIKLPCATTLRGK